MSTHRLKITPQYFGLVLVGMKTAQVRFNDRDYKAGDYLFLCEFDGAKFTGENVLVEITHILYSSDFSCGLKDGYCVLSFEVASVRMGYRSL
ncbi:DUF3850 domain-containing protein [Pseudoalteromonas sp. K222D]|uniref:DUF3850 domain-containing protein n=1 Tax=Pseudoalteromonas sp. K222D TaxID=2820756 RepID=UPI001AD77698|nr:DUF3850 domain-containing protein [Pseudoalteromonas sp. K222D]MBO7928007.1 DUF3850 domain-containing protein [Pseudoalteromonas sp. K222D]